MSLSQNQELVELAVRIIDRRIGETTQNVQDVFLEEEVERTIQKYDRCYSRASSVPRYQHFDARGDGGIPRLVDYFTSFDPINAVGPFNEWTIYSTTPTDLQIDHVHSYLVAPEFNSDLLSTTKYDRVVNAIFSYLLTWTDEGLFALANEHPRFKRFVFLFLTEKGRAPVYVVDADNVPFIRSSFRLLTQFFKRSDGPNEKTVRSEFSIKNSVPCELVAHFEDVYQKLLNQSFTREDVRRIECYMQSPFASTAIEFSGRFNEFNLRPKVVTGQACCGKTTLLEKLKARGWKICSRGYLGTFSGKCRSAAAIAGLHAALENALRRGDVLGDRGAIDNPLWSVIMPLCDPKYKDRVVEELMDYFSGTINEHVLAYMFNQLAVVFVDPHPSANRERMMNRCTGGDAFRARIHMYPITQFIAYYMAARIFGWTVRCVPYDDQGNFTPDRYSTIADELIKLFGEPLIQRELTMASKPIEYHIDDTEYPIATGIFK